MNAPYPNGEQLDQELFRQFQRWQASQKYQGPCMGCEGGYCGGGYPQGGNARQPKVLLDEKDFRRVDKFDGEPAKFRGWLFDVFTALNHIDSLLAADLHGLLARDAINGKAEKWEPGLDLDCDHHRYVKYHGELFGILALLTCGEAKIILRSM